MRHGRREMNPRRTLSVASSSGRTVAAGKSESFSAIADGRSHFGCVQIGIAVSDSCPFSYDRLAPAKPSRPVHRRSEADVGAIVGRPWCSTGSSSSQPCLYSC